MLSSGILKSSSQSLGQVVSVLILRRLCFTFHTFQLYCRSFLLCFSFLSPVHSFWFSFLFSHSILYHCVPIALLLLPSFTAHHPLILCAPKSASLSHLYHHANLKYVDFIRKIYASIMTIDVHKAHENSKARRFSQNRKMHKTD